MKDRSRKHAIKDLWLRLENQLSELVVEGWKAYCCYPIFDTLIFMFRKKDKKYKKDENPKISCYGGKIEKIENLTVNAGSNRINWKSRTKLKRCTS